MREGGGESTRARERERERERERTRERERKKQRERESFLLYLHMTLRRQVINFIGPNRCDKSRDVTRIRQITIMEKETNIIDVPVFI